MTTSPRTTPPPDESDLMGANPFDLSGRNAIVTGAVGPLGRALATALAEVGANVSVTTTHDSAEEETAANSILNECWSHGRKGIAHALLGSVAEKVVRGAQCPVLVIRPKE